MMPAQSGHQEKLIFGWALPRREILASVFAVTAEAAILFLVVSSHLSLQAALQLHVVVTAMTGVSLFQARGASEDMTFASLMLLVLLVAGPAGAVSTLAALAFVDHAGAGPDVLNAWYDRLSNASDADLSTVLTDRVMAGRVIDTDAATPAQFETVIADGTLAERQAALGLIARRFHPDFAPALEQALRSPEPVVRVQAAAVVARVRADLKTRIKALVAAGPVHAPADPIQDAAELVRLAGCSLVDRADAGRCRKASDARLQLALAGKRNVYAAAARADSEAALLIERHLMTSERYEDFRSARRIHRLTASRAYRVRFGRGPQIKQSMANS